MATTKQLLSDIARKIESGDAEGVKNLTLSALDNSVPAEQILNQGLVPGMEQIGEKFKNNEVFIPEVLIAARAMKTGMQILKPLLAEAKVASKGKIIMGTIKGDLHDIGKNIVSMLLEGAGYDVVDMGTDVSLEKVLQTMETFSPDMVGLSALLTTTMVNMREVIEGLKKNKLRNKIKVIIGGAPITQAYADEIGADGYAPDAATSVDLVKKLLVKTA